MLTAISIPRCTGCTPSAAAIGNRIGAMIRTIADGSMKLPAASSTMLMTSRNAIVPNPWAVIHSAMDCGICSEVSSHENTAALVMM